MNRPSDVCDRESHRRTPQRARRAMSLCISSTELNLIRSQQEHNQLSDSTPTRMRDVSFSEASNGIGTPGESGDNIAMMMTELARLEAQAKDTINAYVSATIDYVSAIHENKETRAPGTIKKGQLRRKALLVRDRLDDFTKSARHIISILTDPMNRHGQKYSVASHFDKLHENGRGASTNLHKLTQREFDVLELLLKGLPNKQIGYQLGISVATAKTHVSAIFRKLNVSNRARVIALLVNVR